MSKLDYLKKYGLIAESDASKYNNTSKKRKRKESSKHDNDKVVLIDEDDLVNTKNIMHEDDDLFGLNDDDGPVIVEDVDISSSAKILTGEWTDLSRPKLINENDESNLSRTANNPINDDESPSFLQSVHKSGAISTRHDSDDEEPPRRQISGRQLSIMKEPPTSLFDRYNKLPNLSSRHDSDDEEPPRRQAESRSSSIELSTNSSGHHIDRLKSKSLYDDDDEEPRRRPLGANNSVMNIKSSSSSMDYHNKKTASKRHDSDDEEPPRRQLVDASKSMIDVKPSSSSVSYHNKTTASKRHDSDDEEPPRRNSLGDHQNVAKAELSLDAYRQDQISSIKVVRHDNEDEEPTRRSRQKEMISRDPRPRSESKERFDASRHDHKASKYRAQTSSGHFAGLQSGDDFGKKERELQKVNQLALSAADKTLSGQLAETVYRDKSGKKVDMLDDYIRKQAIAQSKQIKIQSAQEEYNLGTTQKEQAIDRIKELEEIAAEPFARTIDDPKLESLKKDTIRDGDPMAEYFHKKKEKEHRKAHGNITSKPVYQGPNITVNRFNIKPGYRWDGIDRGNGFENKVLNMLNSKVAYKEDEYKWSVSDM